MFLLFSFVSAADRIMSNPLGGPGLHIHITSPTDWCTFLPPKPGMSIAESEGYPNASPEEVKRWAIAFCTDASKTPKGSMLLYDGFITGFLLYRAHIRYVF
jgi:hypothetical protein